MNGIKNKELKLIESVKRLDSIVNLEIDKLSNIMSKFQKIYPATACLLQSILYYIYGIDDSIRLLLEQNRLFASNMLYRSLIEAFVELNYVSNKFRAEKEDFSEKYLLLRLADERVIKAKNNVNLVNKFDGTGLSRNEKKRIIEAPSMNEKFITIETYKNFKSTLSEKIKYLYRRNPEFNDENEIVGIILRDYSNLSSFVHINYEGFQNFVKLENSQKELIERYTISFTIKLLSYRSFAQLCLELMKEENIDTKAFDILTQELFTISDFLFE